MEELVGRLWHRFITRAASTEHEAARVPLQDMQRTIDVLFKAAGGSAAMRVCEAQDQVRGGPRTWLQHIAGSGTHAALPLLDTDSLSLPVSLAVFKERALNQDLYIWLAVLAACHVNTGQWIEDNIWASQCALLAFPGLVQRYRRLVDAHLQQRPEISRMNSAAAAAERGIQGALRHTLCPALPTVAPPSGWPACQPADVSPVWLWLCPTSDATASAVTRQAAAGEQPAGANQPQKNDAKRRKAQHAQDKSDRAGMMMFFRAESILSWSEHVRINRQTDDEDDGNASKAADDMQNLAIAPDGQSSAARVKFDLDLPGAAQDDLPLGPGVHLPEWHWKKQVQVPDQCCVQLLEARQPATYVPPPALATTAKRVRRRLEVLRSVPRHIHAQTTGDELDLDAWVQWRSDAQASPRHEGDAPIYARRQHVERSLACLLLADLSLSTDAWANNEQRVIDVIRDALHVFGEALSGLGDPFAMLGFSSVRRHNVRMHLLKRFQEPWNQQVLDRVGAIRPGYYTRMGAAIRYAIKGLETRPERQRLLLLLTDGKPNDLDAYEGRHGLEDTRQAVMEAKAAGLHPYCVTIDQDAHAYLPYLFGQRGYALVHQPSELVSKLSAVYAHLATHKG